MASASHKANFNVDTTDIPSIPTRGDGLHPPVVNPDAPAGSLIIFLEATLREHRNGLLARVVSPARICLSRTVAADCTLPWHNRDHARRSLLYREPQPSYLPPLDPNAFEWGDARVRLLAPLSSLRWRQLPVLPTAVGGGALTGGPSRPGARLPMSAPPP
eukprot:COSAG04_NODE_4959_length_1805_cov_1.365182_1_plen_159_part_10